jgi:uncharacterized membrane protein
VERRGGAGPRSAGRSAADASGRRLVVVGALVLGFGFGGLADGIVLHQVLRWHNLISDVETNETLEGLRRNLFWDGAFHATTAVLTVVGLVVLWHARDAVTRLTRPTPTVVGFLLVGWGAFHVVDQLVFHLLLDLHDIRDGVEHPGVYNWSFFAIGLALAGVGRRLVRAGRS